MKKFHVRDELFDDLLFGLFQRENQVPKKSIYKKERHLVRIEATKNAQDTSVAHSFGNFPTSGFLENLVIRKVKYPKKLISRRNKYPKIRYPGNSVSSKTVHFHKKYDSPFEVEVC